MVNPDGLVCDLTGSPYRSWRKNRQDAGHAARVGTDLNRNYGYRWGCCGGSSGTRRAWTYRGPRAWSAPETRAMRDFVQSRVIDGRQRIRTHITFHTAGEMVLWPYGYTYADVPAGHDRARPCAPSAAMGRAMAATNGYRAQQSSACTPPTATRSTGCTGATASSRSRSRCTRAAAARRAPLPARRGHRARDAAQP